MIGKETNKITTKRHKTATNIDLGLHNRYIDCLKMNEIYKPKAKSNNKKIAFPASIIFFDDRESKTLL